MDWERTHRQLREAEWLVVSDEEFFAMARRPLLNLMGVVALIALVSFVGWALIGGNEDNQPSQGVAVATTPARR
jgi:hypothetical protein